MSSMINNDAASFIRNVRSAIEVNESNWNQFRLESILHQCSNSNYLIHTNYFENERFMHFLVCLLELKGYYPLNKENWHEKQLLVISEEIAAMRLKEPDAQVNELIKFQVKVEEESAMRSTRILAFTAVVISLISVLVMYGRPLLTSSSNQAALDAAAAAESAAARAEEAANRVGAILKELEGSRAEEPN